MTSVREITREDTLAAITATNVHYVRSDSGEVVMVLKAPLMLQYNDEDDRMEFPKGFEVNFLDSLQQPSSRIKAQNGLNYERAKLMIARGNVEVENFETGEILNTEILYWNQQQKKIFTRAPVKITGPEKIIFGDSLTAAEDLSNRIIYNIRATLEIDEED